MGCCNGEQKEYEKYEINFKDLNYIYSPTYNIYFLKFKNKKLNLVFEYLNIQDSVNSNIDALKEIKSRKLFTLLLKHKLSHYVT